MADYGYTSEPAYQRVNSYLPELERIQLALRAKLNQMAGRRSQLCK